MENDQRNITEEFHDQFTQLDTDIESTRIHFNDLLANVKARGKKIQILANAIENLSRVTLAGSYIDLEQTLRSQLIKALELCDMVDSGNGLLQLVENQLDGTRELVVYAYYIQDQVTLELKRLALDPKRRVDRIKGITAVAATTGNVILIEDIRSDSRKGQFVHMISGTISSLSVPVKVGGGVIAVINLEHNKPKAFTEEHKNWVVILSHLISTNVNRMWQHKQLEGFRKLIAASTQPRALKDVIPIITEAVTQITGAETIIILIRKLKTNQLILEDEYEIRVKGKPVRDNLVVNIGEGVSGRAVANGNIVYIRDVTQEGEIKEGRIVDNDGNVLYIQYLEDTKANMGIPLPRGEEYIGALVLESPRQNAFDHLSQDVTAIIAAGVSSILQMAENIKTINEYSDELLEAQMIFEEQHIAERISSLHNITAREMIGDIVDLQKALPSIKDDAAAMKIIHRLADTANFLSNETRKAIKIQRADAGLGITLEDALERVLQTTPLEGINLHEDYDPAIGLVVVLGRLELILKNLFDNVIKHVGHGNLWVGAYLDNTHVHFSIRDDGPGIPLDRHDAVKKHGVTGGTERDGMGIGLSLADWCVKVANKGKNSIEIDSDIGKGTTILFSLPRLYEGPDDTIDSQIKD